MTRLEQIKASIGYWDCARCSIAPKKALYATLWVGVMEELLGMAEEAEKLRKEVKEFRQAMFDAGKLAGDAHGEIKKLRGRLGFTALGPTIVCLCGSTRFMDAFFEAGWRETLKGKIVLSVGVCKHGDHDGAHGAEALGPEVVELLDRLHLRKIDLADEVFILNVGGYIGDSTRSELEYARAHGKPVRFLEQEKGEDDDSKEDSGQG